MSWNPGYDTGAPARCALTTHQQRSLEALIDHNGLSSIADECGVSEGDLVQSWDALPPRTYQKILKGLQRFYDRQEAEMALVRLKQEANEARAEAARAHQNAAAAFGDVVHAAAEVVSVLRAANVGGQFTEELREARKLLRRMERERRAQLHLVDNL